MVVWCYSLVAVDDSQSRTTRSNPPARSVVRKNDPQLQPITASLLIPGLRSNPHRTTDPITMQSFLSSSTVPYSTVTTQASGCRPRQRVPFERRQRRTVQHRCYAVARDSVYTRVTWPSSTFHAHRKWPSVPCITAPRNPLRLLLDSSLRHRTAPSSNIHRRIHPRALSVSSSGGLSHRLAIL